MEKRFQIMKKEVKKIATSNCKILDIGCYDGSFLRLLTKGQKVKGIGVDILKENIKRANLMKNKNSFIIGDALHLPFRSNTFDIVIAGELIEHFETPLQFLYEIKRVLAPSGKLILSTPNLFGLWSILHDHIKIIFRFLIKGYSKPAHVSLFTLKTLIKATRIAEYKICKIYTLGPELEKVLTALMIKIFPNFLVKKTKKLLRKGNKFLSSYLSKISNGWVLVAAPLHQEQPKKITKNLKINVYNY